MRPVGDDGVGTTPTKREAVRIPFGSFVESGAIPAGSLLFDRMRRTSAVVVADGSIRANTPQGAIQGSIHKVGAEVQNAPSCNGWTFWHLERDGLLVAIDVLRTEARAHA